jgi:UDP-glucose:(heptosyl)LPS alpha-1,3-glucosyltransferase
MGAVGVNYRVIVAGFTCQPCGKAGCGDSGVSDCITAITPQQVLSAIDTMLLKRKPCMKLAIVRQTYNPNGGAERFVSRALNVLAQDTSLDVTLIARQWEDAAGWKTLTVNPPFRNRIARESGFALEAAAHFAQFDIVQSHERIPGATIFRAGDGVHATWLEQYGRILSPLARWAQSLSRYHRYILQAEAQMFTHPQLRKVICNSKMVRDDIARRFRAAGRQADGDLQRRGYRSFQPEVRAFAA